MRNEMRDRLDGSFKELFNAKEYDEEREKILKFLFEDDILMKKIGSTFEGEIERIQDQIKESIYFDGMDQQDRINFSYSLVNESIQETIHHNIYHNPLILDIDYKKQLIDNLLLQFKQFNPEEKQQYLDYFVLYHYRAFASDVPLDFIVQILKKLKQNSDEEVNDFVEIYMMMFYIDKDFFEEVNMMT